MPVRTFYWDASRGEPVRWPRRPKPGQWRHGNAGDEFNTDLIDWAYPGLGHTNDADAGPRVLLVGSTVHRALDGDVLAGVGSKGVAVPRDVTVRIVGLRGPRTLAAVEEAGHDTGDLRFLGDPGLLIGEVHPSLQEVDARRGRVAFIPHYRERAEHASTRRYRLVDIDATPLQVGREIRRAEVVLTSSLHGLVWAHALGRPAVLVQPRTPEPEIKYVDYTESVGLAWRTPPTLDEALEQSPSATPHDVSAVVRQIALPTLEELRGAGVTA
ncbi:polysaccharide pyruvyl transferase family protein [Nocardioides zeae]|uniref:Polysaccharide pyruvyl transferase family protein n=1 Tax=Nocardioides imazamoxiresistens TaxID=3231893 RepID=A0ABU3PS34_9ACTN|nr:polysaccharide pyruvyl transferase family protein [Nocardioides zeae]MDT9592009.1 polysaccharide pyruvyl transferase family protein [Nocardioides zeae]